MKVYFDGASKGNPGNGGSAFVVFDDEGRECHHDYKKHEHCTNNEAEYNALIMGLEWIEKNCKNVHVDIYGDSKLVIEQMNKKWKVKSDNIKELHKKALILATKLDVSYNHVVRELNKDADYYADLAAKLQMDKQH